VRVIDWNEPSNNDFFLASQFWVSCEMYKRRADLVGFVNGLPLIFIELKASHKRMEHAYRDNLRDYKNAIPQIFWYNGFIILSNGSQSKIGSMTAEWEHFAEWKKINSEASGGIVKLVVKNHQYLGVNNATEALKQIEKNRGRLGVFWHTQGSGKSYSMVFFSQKVLRKIPGNFTFVIVTDRQDLDNQIYKNFAGAGAVTEEQVQAESGEHLKHLLREDHRYIFTLMEKSELVELLRQVIEDTTAFCSELGIDLAKIQTAYGFERVRLIDDAVDAILVNDESKRKYIALAGNIVWIYRSILPDPAAGEFYPKQALFANLAEKMRSMVIEADISGVMKAVDELLDDSISTEGYVIRQPEPSETEHLVDLSRIDFEALKARFQKKIND
jgi:hypothetical protein